MNRKARYGLKHAAGISLTALALLPASGSAQPVETPDDFGARCRALAGRQSAMFGTVTAAAPGPVTFEERNPFASRTLTLPPHCEITGTFAPRKGAHGQTYAIRYHLRLPKDWNGRFLFQGGGGHNGVLGDALGALGAGNQPGFLRGYAVVSQDSGHDEAVNRVAARGGAAVYGTDPQARRDYGHASLPRVAYAAKALIRQFYGSDPRFSYFSGCSKGGQEGMAFAQLYPEIFDGIVAAAPGFSLPRAALAQAWDVQVFARLWDPAKGKLAPAGFATLFNENDFRVLRDVIGKSCDALDGLRDGIVGAFGQCTGARVLPALRARVCGAGKGTDCLASAKIKALAASLAGPRDARGKTIYADWPWDLGIGSPGWSFWKLGNQQMPAFNILTAGGSLSSVFMVPPRAVAEDPQSQLDFLLSVRFPGDAAAIYATAPGWPRSAWQDVGMRSPNLDAFRSRGGKLIVPHGVADPVFSINDTLHWRDEVNARYKGRADDVVRVFPVPGMAHCGGGPATDRFDAFTALTDWVEKGRAPGSIPAAAGPDTPWPDRKRPLCAYPRIARYDGKGPIDEMTSFRCEAIRSRS